MSGEASERDAREEERRARVRAAVVRLVDAAPPLSERQRERLRAILAGWRRPPPPDPPPPDGSGHRDPGP
ncbi:hypothetical protein LHJ74_20380 [Streptomyces sp. N2-109]|uniref:Uncharacterized protein n=1 Tax=Streptomyces gossypii TaxID=2883101 RepID=A0ABT2JWF0_9ACTN|nr:hypothetical protein [Streptomyces gossypii]MCT2592230.1 hypothetical protein [Streptomyces gossypii]